MTTTRQRRGKTVESPKKCNASPGSMGVKKFINKSGQHQKAAGVLPSTAAQLLGQQLATQTSFPQTTEELPTTEITTDQFHPSTKIKLQLFPIDEVTREGLEKDGYNPFLELTLRARKKISSVLKHIDTKWGSSSIALGEPILVPYNIQLEKCSDKRWTLNDTCIRAGDVYAAIDRPTIFRLRYGWFSNLEPKMPFKSSPLEAILGSEGIPKACVAKLELTPDSRKEFEATSEEFEKPNNMSKTVDAVVTEQMSVDLPVNHLVDEVKMDNSLGQSVVPWDDCSTNLSIGGLFSEASLLGKVDNCISNQNQQQLQQIQLISDISMGRLFCEASLQGKINNFESAINGSKSSLHTTVDKGLAQPPFPWDDSLTTLSIGGLLSEASLKGKIHSHPQPAKPSLHDSHSSILDAEETCHAFALRKFSPSSKDDASSNSLTFPCFSKLKKQVGLAQDPPHQESKTDQLPGSRIYNEDNSLGLTGIKWNDSLGPFDLGMSRQVMGGDSISFSKIVR